MDESTRPMLAVAGELPRTDDGWAYEFKWDGVRVLAHVRGGALRLRARSGTDVTERYPELAVLPASLADREAVLDGEVVALDAQGRPDFGLLQQRMHLTGPEVARTARRVPASYFVFDLLALDGESLLDRPYRERRVLLDTLEPAARRWSPTPWFDTDGARVQAASREHGLEGVVAKRLASPYRPGGRGPEWLKVKNVQHQSVVVGGWRPGNGRRAGGIGSLLVGVQGPGGLRYAGRVGTGFTDRALRELARDVTGRTTSPFAGEVPADVVREAHWVEPELVGEVVFAGWTGDGHLRHPAWRGLRDDVVPTAVVPE
ncbi:non-homologous end-joining DNA ligase [Klenkia soli]|uniref:non-homologous end-joining DNA ligase n=1 Tax=Klenkia soli TaxID=1052260 RepID=UPI001F60C6C0|nr:non-homologous end-joining DNA ligase [Klenkia soli]